MCQKIIPFTNRGLGWSDVLQDVYTVGLLLYAFLSMP